MSPEERHEITVLKNNAPRTDIKPERISLIVEEMMYWRKFNALHQWFVNACQDGVDDCRKSYVSKSDLKELLNTLKEIRKDNSKAQELLPTTAGFFFGGTDYDEYYFEQVNVTIQKLEELDLDNDNNDGSYYYQSSW